jgi:hypothetical protein
LILVSVKAKYFRATGLTRFRKISASGKSLVASMVEDRRFRAGLRGCHYARFPRFATPSNVADSDKEKARVWKIFPEFRNNLVGKSAKIRLKSCLFKPE